jgi:5'-nucleotidase/UDP-sugar diphosphatase
VNDRDPPSNAGKVLLEQISINFGRKSSRMKRFFLLILAIPTIYYGRIQAQPCDCQWPTDVIILHVNDMHSKIDNMGKLAYLVDSLERTCRHVFLVSAGDNFTGNPVVDMVPDTGSPMVDLMNRCGFDVSAIGNHEFDMGQEGLNRRFKQADFPFVSCNIDAAGAVLKQPKPYVMKRVGKGNRIAFIGLTQVGANGLPNAHPARLEGLKFSDPVATALGYVRLKDKDVLIAVTHLGKETDIELASRMPQLDLIIGGHSHDRLDTGLISNGVLITQAGKDLKYVGKTFLRLDKGRVIYRSEEMIPMNILTKSDPKVQELIDRYNDNEELDRSVGFAEAPLEGYDQLGSLMRSHSRTAEASGRLPSRREPLR